ncbi:nucleoside-diphosphate-sugar epimerase [Halobacteroides halobius DSM 5150]|uniref:Nucleoside-diphosphate-sugar epimerase n=1 Tax=Halobacteroides halobius (strain ATCC 35273 / DSM 5150 / MD-1) TaxID=748449 RepID=L0KA24_HALHC|nr:NAD-dependent epimerase/dehydratase family protein [Halobacteroides halobius]AGB41224.1 nucleoside-diphosphate-sugar epimerase [Halobacteroides halobius DSM 5150]
MKTILITGGAGFIGSHIVDKLITRGDQVIIIDNLSTGKKENINSKAKFYQIDIRDNLTEIFTKHKIDYIIHHAAQSNIQSSIKNPSLDSEINIVGTVNLLEYASSYDIVKFIYASSAAVYGRPQYLGINEEHPITPISYYGVAKHTPEHYIKIFNQLYELNYTILRYANVYGERQEAKGEGGVVAVFIDKILREDKPIIYGDGKQTRDFVYVKDVARANLAALEKGDEETINISCDQQTSINQLFKMIKQITNINLEPIYQAARPGDIKHNYLLNNKAQRLLDWSPKYNLERGLKETLAYYQKS